jgi:sugar lactone lactonase YvrE
MLATVCGACAAAARGATIVCDGVIGNSGQQGAELVRFAPGEARGMGVVADRFGSLWDRAGRGVLNRYARDGRLLGQYPLPDAAGGGDQLTLAGDTLVLLVAGQLYRLDVAAAAGTKPTALKVAAEHISFGSKDGAVACVDRDKKLFLVDVATGQKTDVCDLAAVKGLDAVEMGPDGTIYVQGDWKTQKVVVGKLVADWSRGSPGERPQWIDGAWFGHGWHGTIRRFDADIQPDPGVVLGGASGSFIGHLPQDPELSNGRGMARLDKDLYTVGGVGGTMHLLHWDAATRKMEIVRRIGAMPTVGGIGLDRQGRIWAIAGSWEWTDGPVTPMRFGVNGPDGRGIGQAVMLPSDAMVAPGILWGQAAMYSGRLDDEVRGDRIGTPMKLPKGYAGSASYVRDKQRVLLVVDQTGAGQAFRIAPDGRFEGDAGDVRLQFAGPGADCTSLAMKDDETLLVAAGQVIELARDGAGWRESRRWNSWGAAAEERFGAGHVIHIAADDGRLWVADTARHRVVCFDLKTGKPVATFGTADKAGTDLGSLTSPAAIAARGTRAVVHDAGNQRLLKLRLE